MGLVLQTLTLTLDGTNLTHLQCHHWFTAEVEALGTQRQIWVASPNLGGSEAESRASKAFGGPLCHNCSLFETELLPPQSELH